ncbi:recombinase family protein [Alkalihalophilus marmarensis]|uniref:recombinase family protein n=1 Tax=Alkalihalophilus marmarensis TaxID=521377 RepID=UPI002DBBCD5E|nr:recombinase family protein [Alkalihalophilus marmarensis]MEC2073751.1 recombinase family protein [Alkalihalophilus marmarensis]
MEGFIKEKQRKVVFYGRYSTADQNGDTQRANCQIFAKNHDLDIIDEYLDENKSAFRKTIESRRQLRQLLKDAEEKKFNTVLVYKADRIARNAEQHIKLWSTFLDLEIDVIDVSGPKLYTTDSIETVAIDFGLSNFESENISIRTKDYYNTHTKFGKWLGGILPYGFKYIDDESLNGQKKIEQIPHRVVKIKEIFELYSEGHGFQTVANMLAEQYPNDFWVKEKVKAIITNPFYCGYTTSQRTYKNAGSSIRPRSEWIIGLCEKITPVVTKEKWESCMELYESKLKDPIDSKKLTTSFLLRDVIYCEKCNIPLRAKNATSGKRRKDGRKYEYFYYVCDSCKYKWKRSMIDGDITEKLIHNWALGVFFGNREKILSEEVRASLQEDINQLNREITDLQMEWDKLNLEKSKASVKLEELNLSAEEFERQMQLVMVQQRIIIQKRMDTINSIKVEKEKKRNQLIEALSKGAEWMRKTNKHFDIHNLKGNPKLRNLILSVIQKISIDESYKYKIISRIDIDVMEDTSIYKEDESIFIDEEENFEKG